MSHDANPVRFPERATAPCPWFAASALAAMGDGHGR